MVGMPYYRPQSVHRKGPFCAGCQETTMNLTISGHHLEVTPALRNYVLDKLDRVSRHFDQLVGVGVTLSVEKSKEKERRHHAQINVRVKGRDIPVEGVGEDLYAVIDGLMDKLDRVICSHKEQVQDHRAGHRRYGSPKRLGEI